MNQVTILKLLDALEQSCKGTYNTPMDFGLVYITMLYTVRETERVYDCMFKEVVQAMRDKKKEEEQEEQDDTVKEPLQNDDVFFKENYRTLDENCTVMDNGLTEKHYAMLISRLNDDEYLEHRKKWRKSEVE